MMPDALDIREERTGTSCVVVVAGDLDASSAPRFGEVLTSLHLDGAPVVVDLAGIRFIDSSGLQQLIDAKRRSEDHGARLVLRRPSRRVRQLLELTELQDAFLYE